MPELNSNQNTWVNKALYQLTKDHTTLIATPPGSGKTIMALHLADVVNLVTLNTKILVVCPKNVITQWYDNAKVFNIELTVVNYESVCTLNVIDTQYDLIIFDEIHNVKNHNTKVWHDCAKLRANYRIGLSGTPILNKPNDLYAIFRILRLRIPHGGGYKLFCAYYCETMETKYGVVVKGLTQNIAHINELIAHLNSQCVWVSNVFQVPINNHQITCGKVSPATMFSSYCSTEKGTWLQQWISHNIDTPCIIFSKFITVLETFIHESKIYSGDKTPREKAILLEDFKTGDMKRLYATLGSLSEGVDGLQQVCNTIIFLDWNFNPEVNNQAVARVNRLGQTQDHVDVYWLTDTFDTLITQINNKKAKELSKLNG